MCVRSDRHDGAGPGADDLHIAAVGDADRIEIERVDMDRRTRREVHERPRHLGSDCSVVQLATHHQPIVIAVPTGCGEDHGFEGHIDRAGEDTVGGCGERLGRHAGKRRDAGCDERSDVSDGRHAAQWMVGSERPVADHQAEFDGDHPVGSARTGCGDLLGEGRDTTSRFVVVPAFSPYADAARTTSACWVDSQAKVSIDGSVGRRRSPGERDRHRDSR